MFGTETREIIPVNECHPAIVAVQAQQEAAAADLERWTTEEQRLKQILDPLPESSSYSPPFATAHDKRDAKSRLRADLGETVVRFFYLPERRLAEQRVEDLKVEHARVHAQAIEALKQQVRAHAADLLSELEDALKPLRTLAGELVALETQSQITVPHVCSEFSLGFLENELQELRQFVTG